MILDLSIKIKKLSKVKKIPGLFYSKINLIKLIKKFEVINISDILLIC